MQPVLPLLVAAALAGCAAEPTLWYKPGGTQREFDLTMARCRMQARMVPSTGNALVDSASFSGHINDCLMVEGWSTRRP